MTSTGLVDERMGRGLRALLRLLAAAARATNATISVAYSYSNARAYRVYHGLSWCSPPGALLARETRLPLLATTESQCEGV